MDLKHRLRIAIVQTLYRFTVPQPLRTVRYADSIMIENADPALVAEVWRELIEAGRIVPNDVYPDHCGLAPALRKRLDNRENIQDDLFLYGPDALRRTICFSMVRTPFGKGGGKWQKKRNRQTSGADRIIRCFRMRSGIKSAAFCMTERRPKRSRTIRT